MPRTQGEQMLGLISDTVSKTFKQVHHLGLWCLY